MLTDMKTLVSLCKRRGFVFQGSEIYGGLANTWDYGPMGVELRNNIKQQWWKTFVQDRQDIIGLDSAILLNPRVWEASGHLGSFHDFQMDCRQCKERFRPDKLIEEKMKQRGDPNPNAAGWTPEQMKAFLAQHPVACPHCGQSDFTEMRHFNLMFKTHQGVIEDSTTVVYLRPETAQGIFLNFQNIINSSRKTIPFGIGQIGKSFRNEITPGNFIFRTREFEQMEMEYFCHPNDAGRLYEEWCQFCVQWLRSLGMGEDNLRLRQHAPEELSHYSCATSDIEYRFPFGWGELWGIAHRGDYDLTQHAKFSGADLSYRDSQSGEQYVPHVIEPALGLDRLLLAFLVEAYHEETVKDETRVILKIHPKLAPIKVAILPLSKKLNEKAYEIFQLLCDRFVCEFDVTQSIGKRYRRQDEIGTPLCVTIDFDTLEDQAVTIRERDSMEQIRLPLTSLEQALVNKLR